MRSEIEVRRAVDFLETIWGKLEGRMPGTPLADCLMAAFEAGKAAVEKHGYRLQLSPGGLTWREELVTAPGGNPPGESCEGMTTPPGA